MPLLAVGGSGLSCGLLITFPRLASFRPQKSVGHLERAVMATMTALFCEPTNVKIIIASHYVAISFHMFRMLYTSYPDSVISWRCYVLGF